MAFTLRYREQWPLWSVQKKIYRDRVWVELDEVPGLEDQPHALKQLAVELRRLERRLCEEGIMGWIASVKLENTKMQRLLTMIGAVPYARDGAYQYFYKVAGVPVVPDGLLAIFRQARRQQEVAHA